MSSFSIALSGLTAASTDLSVTANNIANADTIGFKSSRAEFADLYASGAANLNQSVTGEGVELATNAQQFTQGDITTTSSNLDLAISGDGFFTLQSSSGLSYTRNGQFQEDSSGNVVTPDGSALQVYPTLPNGGFNTGTLVPLNLQTSQSAPSATTTGSAILNLPANTTPPVGTPFNPNDSTTYNESTSTTVYDSLGNAYPATYYFSAVAGNANEWAVNMTVNGKIVTAVPTTSLLTFGANGSLASASNAGVTNAQGNLTFAYAPTDGAAAMNMTFNFGKTTAYGGQFGVTSITQNGYATGQLSTVAVDSQGIVSAVYTNGRSTELGQLAMANFPNPQGLKQLGNTSWSETFDSGNVVQGTAGSASFGTIQSGALESSNVDLTTELVNMITAQRAFDANAQVVTTANQESQTVTQISR
jgi:flagellar hook protein FlgE